VFSVADKQGEVVRLGRRLGVPTPVHQLVYAALKLRPGYRSRMGSSEGVSSQ
jgi:ketopantoate reductase